MNAGVPCRSFSITSHSNKGRTSKSNPNGHGFNFRKTDQFRTPCCPRESGCKYAKLAHEHDDLARGCKKMFEHGQRIDPEFAWGIENAAYGDLPRREYMQPSQWKVPYQAPILDMCAYGGRYKAPKIYYTSMLKYVPKGRTGNGRCNNGQCGQGQMINGEFVHDGKLGRQHSDGPKGPGALRQKNRYPIEWCRELLLAAQKQRGHNARIVIDLFSGWQSLAPACQELGLQYIGIDIMGDRNRFIKGQSTGVHSHSCSVLGNAHFETEEGWENEMADES